jgi:nicotinamidase/pyrazinamidase
VSRALIIVDVQVDFLPGGALAVPDGDAVIEPINALAANPSFDIVIATRDWHPADHASFTAQGGTWPPHCVKGTRGAQLSEALDQRRIDLVIDKGTTAQDEGYSAFESDELRSLVRVERVQTATIVGLAADFCVLHTARDALREGLRVTIPRDGVRGIDAEGTESALSELAELGAQLTPAS